MNSPRRNSNSGYEQNSRDTHHLESYRDWESCSVGKFNLSIQVDGQRTSDRRTGNRRIIGQRAEGRRTHVIVQSAETSNIIFIRVFV